MALTEATKSARSDIARMDRPSPANVGKPALGGKGETMKPASGVLASAASTLASPSPAEQKVTDAEARLAQAEQQLEAAQGSRSVPAIERAAENVRTAEADLQEARLELEVEQAQERLDSLVANRASIPAIENASNELAEATRALQDFRIERIMDKSPTLEAAVADLEAAGWTIEDGAAGGGSYANFGTQTITLDRNLLNNPEAYVQVLAHEAGHALDGQPPFTPIGDLTRAEFVEANTNAYLASEGQATLYNAQIRAEIMGNGGPDIGVAGAQSADYIAIYDQVAAGTLSEADAADQIGQLFGAGEITSNTGQNYQVYYGGFFGDYYDNNTP